jgi:thioredoxin-dependent peroxiredoxin
MIEIGKKAPPLSLPDERGKPVSLDDFRGRWVVLYFYPKDDTPGCTVQACDFTSGLKAFEKLDAVVLGCSPDEPSSHQRFIQKHDLRIKLLSDPTHETMERYGAWGKKIMYGVPRVGVIRSTVLIDPRGDVAHHWKKVRAGGHAEKVREKVAELRGG